MIKVRKQILKSVRIVISLLTAIAIPCGSINYVNAELSVGNWKEIVITEEESVDIELSGTEDEKASIEPSGTEDKKAKLIIDNDNCYEGMTHTYSDGYVPTVENNQAIIVLPLLCTEGELVNHELSAVMNLGDASSMPFVNKNYKKTVRQQTITFADDGKSIEVYLVMVNLELKEDRVNGSYPVTVAVNGRDMVGNTVEQTFTIYVNITDGIDENAETATEAVTEEPVSFVPKVLVEDCRITSGTACAGNEMEVTVTLRNTSKEDSIQNMTVTVAAPEDYFTILASSDSSYVGSIPAGGTVDVILRYQVNPETPQGQYSLALSMDYADSKGNTYSCGGNAKININQQVKVEFDPIQYASDAKLGETISIAVRAMNLGRGKVSNVRAVIECDGLVPEGTIFIGNMEGGTTASAEITAQVTALSKGTGSFGDTEGTVTYLYEDEAGKEYTLTEAMQFSVRSPFSEVKEEEEDDPFQWWIIVSVLGGLILISAAILMVQMFLKKKAEREEMEEIQYEERMQISENNTSTAQAEKAE